MFRPVFMAIIRHLHSLNKRGQTLIRQYKQQGTLCTNTIIPPFSRGGLDSKPPPSEKRKCAHIWPHPPHTTPKKISVVFTVLLFFTETLCSELLLLSLHLHAVWLEDQFKLSNNFYALFRWRVWAMCFYFWGGGTPANLRNREVRTHEMREMSLHKLF